MTPRAWPRPRPEFTGAFGAYRALPELMRKTLGDVARSGAGIRIWRQACGRDVRLTPWGIAQRFPLLPTCSVQAFVEASKCGTCGAQEAQATGWSPEPKHREIAILLVREHARGPRLDRALAMMV